jgi:hypothetical protein
MEKINKIKVEKDSWFIILDDVIHQGEVKAGESLFSSSDIIIFEDESEFKSKLKSLNIKVKPSKVGRNAR